MYEQEWENKIKQQNYEKVKKRVIADLGNLNTNNTKARRKKELSTEL